MNPALTRTGCPLMVDILLSMFPDGAGYPKARGATGRWPMTPQSVSGMNPSPPQTAKMVHSEWFIDSRR
jgi:hypothetical protein